MGECFDTYRGGRLPAPSMGELDAALNTLPILIYRHLFISTPHPQFVIGWSNLLETAAISSKLTSRAPGS